MNIKPRGRPRKHPEEYKVAYGVKKILYCSQCHKSFERYSSVIKGSGHSLNHKHFYCSKTCFGKWLGNTIGRHVLEKYREVKRTGETGYKYVIKCLKSFEHYSLTKIKILSYSREISRSKCHDSKIELYDNKYYCDRCGKEIFTWNNNEPENDWTEELLGKQEFSLLL